MGTIEDFWTEVWHNENYTLNVLFVYLKNHMKHNLSLQEH